MSDFTFFGDDEVVGGEDQYDVLSEKREELDRFDTSFAHLSRGKTIGKKVVIPYTGTAPSGSQNVSPINILELKGNDEYASQLCLVLDSPKIIPGVAIGSVDNAQSATGETDNFGFTITGANPVAVVEWGIGGAQSKVEVDFLNGLCMNLQASFLRVGAFCEFVNAQEGIYVLSAFVGPGVAKPNNAQRTVRVGTVAGTNNSPVFRTPRFAKSATMIQTPLNTTCNNALVFYRDLAATIEVGRMGIGQGTSAANIFTMPGIQFNIPNGGLFWRIINNAAVAITELSVMFELAV